MQLNFESSLYWTRAHKWFGTSSNNTLTRLNRELFINNLDPSARIKILLHGLKGLQKIINLMFWLLGLVENIYVEVSLGEFKEVRMRPMLQDHITWFTPLMHDQARQRIEWRERDCRTNKLLYYSSMRKKIVYIQKHW